MCIAPWLTGSEARATSSTSGPSSMASTRSIDGIAASQPAVLPVPRPMTSARRGSGMRSAPMRPSITWVPASTTALPSALPLTMKV